MHTDNLKHTYANTHTNTYKYKYIVKAKMKDVKLIPINVKLRNLVLNDSAWLSQILQIFPWQSVGRYFK